ncbi:MAG: hypothetical protein WAK20_01610 [Candidatus Acidiferrum sp.]
MKSVCLVFLMFFTVPGIAQAPGLSILLGDFGAVRFTLGMTRNEAIRVLSESTLGFTELDSGDVGVHDKDPHSTVGYGTLHFKNNRLSSVTKYWNPDGPDSGTSVVRAIHGAVSSFGKTSHTCVVSTFDDQEPSMEKKGITLDCGKQHLQIFTNRWTGNDKVHEGPVVTEVLGDDY